MTLDELKRVKDTLNAPHWHPDAQRILRVLLDDLIERKTKQGGGGDGVAPPLKDGSPARGLSSDSAAAASTVNRFTPTERGTFARDVDGTIVFFSYHEKALAAKDAEIARLKEYGERVVSELQERSIDAAALGADVRRLTAEIARLKNERDEAQEVIARRIGVHRCDICGDAYEFSPCDGSWRSGPGVFEHACPTRIHPQAGHASSTFFAGDLTKDRDALKAALDEERKACDEASEMIVDDARKLGPNDQRGDWCMRWMEAFRSRRAASRAKEGGSSE